MEIEEFRWGIIKEANIMKITGLEVLCFFMRNFMSLSIVMPPFLKMLRGHIALMWSAVAQW